MGTGWIRGIIMFSTAQTPKIKSNKFSSAGVFIMVCITTATIPSHAHESTHAVQGWSVTERSGGSVYVNSNINEENTDEVSAQLMVETVLSSFGLAVKDYEQIFGVKRATIYNWKKGVQPNVDAQFEKLREVYQIAQHVAPIMNHRAGRLGKTHLYKDTSVVQKLVSSPIDADSTIEHFKCLNTILDKQNKVYQEHKVADNSLSEDTVVYPTDVV